MMRAFTPSGALLLLLGPAALAHRRANDASRETVIEVGSQHATVDREKTLVPPPAVWLTAVASGLALIIAGAMKRT